MVSLSKGCGILLHVVWDWAGWAGLGEADLGCPSLNIASCLARSPLSPLLPSQENASPSRGL